MVYKITLYSYKKAEENDLDIVPSTKKNKKIDVYKNGDKIASIGSIKNLDYPNHILKNGLDYANQKRKLYRLRHKKDINNKNGNGYWANAILW